MDFITRLTDVSGVTSIYSLDAPSICSQNGAKTVTLERMLLLHHRQKKRKRRKETRDPSAKRKSLAVSVTRKTCG
ncbi:MAG: hypothetical protein KBONHNOK_00803 [Candidatus Methanoperedenaceae archaeon GB50]|nr:MAG: hypothetical protein KBONHNOK_00803 [Candidatus Methanoperedenaceae archaeon GB50]